MQKSGEFRPSPDVLLLFVLLIARVRIDTLAEWAAFPTSMLQTDVARLVGRIFSDSGLSLLADRQTTDPVTLLLISFAFFFFFLYFSVDVLTPPFRTRTGYLIKLVLLCMVVGVLVFGQTMLYVGLRHISGPAAYTHDGGVIQTEVATDYLLQGVNPYVADYLDTPMAEWGTEYRTALYHYPYLPWTFVFSAPFQIFGRLLFGWFDQRFIYLLLFVLTLLFAHHLAAGRREKLAVVMILGLNPILASDVIFGQNDSFVLFWIVLGVWAAWKGSAAINQPGGSRYWLVLASVLLGAACASKPTAWFLVPFWGLYLLRDHISFGKDNGRPFFVRTEGWLRIPAAQVLVFGLTFAILVLPWFVWNPGAMLDDVWGWSSGSADIPYQIRGWGVSNLVLAFGLVPDRLAYWPFWIGELVVAVPLLAWLLWRQLRSNTLSSMLYGYFGLLFSFSLVSRFLNENYVGFLLSILALAYFLGRNHFSDTTHPGDGSELAVH